MALPKTNAFSIMTLNSNKHHLAILLLKKVTCKKIITWRANFNIRSISLARDSTIEGSRTVFGLDSRPSSWGVWISTFGPRRPSWVGMNWIKKIKISKCRITFFNILPNYGNPDIWDHNLLQTSPNNYKKYTSSSQSIL